ncbi:response regulator transcription factor [Paenibacillus sp. JDR-2]|uniref:response regulator transcription factor n=1 Tax=Paenibacillus sp. (strain JDR-2) TaxID=324057 RepID=UPI0001663F40|nr:helix-turn-helix domain-containing protein [Paenibacillus sp. JDR-2]ACT02855.1 two component transcriptional regulator, AraC family [Paenibacillus sp. JDR-2]
MKIILVDDERIALEHIRTLIPWEENGYEIAAAATNGRSALRLCEEHRPQIMIVDIRMPVMDGLELIRAVAERGWGVNFIVMSAYEDFNYARQAISLGCVSSYLVKHEVDCDKLILELAKAKLAWEMSERQRKLSRSEQIKEAFFASGQPVKHGGHIARPPLCALLLQADMPFTTIPSVTGAPDNSGTTGWTEGFRHGEKPANWELIGEFAHGAGRLVVLFEQRDKSATVQRDAMYKLASVMQRGLEEQLGRTVSLYLAFECTDIARLPVLIRKLEEAARHTVFSGRGSLACADGLPLPFRLASINAECSRRWLDASASCFMREDYGSFASVVKEWFDSLLQPEWNLNGLYEAIRSLTTLYRERLAAAGLPEEDPLDPRTAGPLYNLADIRDRFLRAFGELSEHRSAALKQLSPKLLQALRYLHAHFQDEIGVEDAANATGISVRYLHELFKRELNRTFLDYLTEYRIKQAKLILMREDAKMAEVSARVGYRSPQHFSQVFKRLTGVLPHQFRAKEQAR